MPDISIAAYTRSSEDRKRLRVKVYNNGISLPKQVEVRVGEVTLYMTVDDANTLAEEMLAAIRQEAVA